MVCGDKLGVGWVLGIVLVLSSLTSIQGSCDLNVLSSCIEVCNAAFLLGVAGLTCTNGVIDLNGTACVNLFIAELDVESLNALGMDLSEIDLYLEERCKSMSCERACYSSTEGCDEGSSFDTAIDQLRTEIDTLNGLYGFSCNINSATGKLVGTLAIVYAVVLGFVLT